MTPRTLTARLVVASTLAVLVAIVGLGVSAEILVAHQMRSSLDAALRRRAADVARLSISAPAVLTAPGALEAPVAGRQLAVEVLDRRGRFVARSLALGAKLLPSGPVAERALARGRPGFADVQLGSEPLRLYAAPIPSGGGAASGGAVLVASSTRDIHQTLHRMSVLLIALGAVAAAAGAAAAALFTRRGMRPLGRLSAAAAEIERTGDAARRLPDRATRDEVGDLARTLNRMLGALDAARRRERRFLADASHELRTPLMSLAGNVDFVARHGPNPEVIADLRLDTTRLQRLVGDLLALEREDGGPPPERPVRLDVIVEQVAAAWPAVRVDANARATVLGEEGALRRALENLVENATVHGPRGGEVTVALTTDAGLATLSVRDEGPGLDPADVAMAFERFWRAPAALSRPGSGLGLAIVRATAGRHHGTVAVAGSTVAIALPLAAVDASERACDAPAGLPRARREG